MERHKVGTVIEINGKKVTVTPWFSSVDPQRITPPARWLKFHKPNGKVYIAPNMKSCGADRYFKRKAVRTRRAESISKMRSTIRHIRASKAASQEMKALEEGQQISSAAGEARTTNFLKAFRKKFNLKGHKIAKKIRQMWKPGMSEDELIELLGLRTV